MKRKLLVRIEIVVFAILVATLVYMVASKWKGGPEDQPEGSKAEAKEDPSLVAQRHLLAAQRLMRKDPSAAREQLEAILQQWPTLPQAMQARLQLAALPAFEGKLREALAALVILARNEPNQLLQVRIYLRIVSLYREFDQLPAAIAFCEKLIQKYLRNDSARAEMTLQKARLLQQLKRPAEARRETLRVLRHFPKKGDVNMVRAHQVLQTWLPKEADALAADGKKVEAGDVFFKSWQQIRPVGDLDATCFFLLRTAGVRYRDAGAFAKARLALEIIRRDYRGVEDQWRYAADAILKTVREAEEQAAQNGVPKQMVDPVDGAMRPTWLIEGEASGTWSPARGIPVLRGKVSVPGGERLLIKAGTHVVGLTDASLVVDGELVVEEGVVFTGRPVEKLPFAWTGLVIRGGRNRPESFLTRCVIELARVGLRIEGRVVALTSVEIRNCGGVGLIVDQGADVRASDLRAISNGEEGILVKGGASLVLARGRIEKNRQSGALVANRGELLVNGPAVFQKNGGSGVEVRAKANARLLDGVRLLANEKEGLFCGAAGAVEMNRGEISKNQRHGVYLERMKAALLEGVTVAENRQVGIYASLTSGMVRQGTITGNAGGGILCGSDARLVITSNHFAANGPFDIQVRRSGEPSITENVFGTVGAGIVSRMVIDHRGTRNVALKNNTWHTLGKAIRTLISDQATNPRAGTVTVDPRPDQPTEPPPPPEQP